MEILRKRKLDAIAEKLSHYRFRRGGVDGWDGYLRSIEPKLWKELVSKK